MLNKIIIKIWMGIIVSLLVFAIFYSLWDHGVFTDSHQAIVTAQNGEVAIIGKDGIPRAFAGQKKVSVGDYVVAFDGEAVLSVDKDFLIWIAPHTEISLKDYTSKSIVVQLNSGSAGYTHLNGSSVAQLIIETPLTNTTPMGAKLQVVYDSVRKETWTIVAQGRALVQDEFSELLLTSIQKSYRSEFNGLREMQVTNYDRRKLAAQLQKEYDAIGAIRMQEVNKYSVPLDMIKEKYSLSDAQIQEYLGKIDRGEVDVEELIYNSPTLLPDLTRIKSLTEDAKISLRTKNAVLTV